MKKTWLEVDVALEIVPTERAEYERSPHRVHDDFWVWNTDPNKTPDSKEKAS